MSRLRNLLEESHKDLHQWILFHQECLLLQHDEYAEMALVGFSDYLTTHIEFENNRLFPAVDASQLRWPVAIYLKEHDKVLAFLTKVTRFFEQYVSLSGREKRLFLLEVLDAQSSFYHLLEHHEEREEQDIFDGIVDNDGLIEQWQSLQTALTARYSTNKTRLKTFLETH